MVKAALLGIIAALMVALGSTAWVAAQEQTIIIAHTDVFKKLQRPPVTFDHEKHYEIYSDCKECHHIYEIRNGKRENVWSGEAQSCSECHKLEKEDNRLPLMTAFHDNCVGCHRALIKEGKKSGPVTCGECHVRRQ